MEGFTPHDQVMQELWDAMTPDRRTEYLSYHDEVEMELQLKELVYQMRTNAGITQTELARRMGTGQPFISAIERGAKSPTVETLRRIAAATGNTLRLIAEPTPA